MGGIRQFSWAAQLLLSLLFIYYWIESGILVAIDIFLEIELDTPYSVVISAKLTSLGYRAIALPRNPPGVGFYSRVQTAMSSRIINPTSQVPSPNKNTRTKKKTKKWKSNDEANSIILKSFTPYTPCECQHERDRVQFFSLITSQSITSDCPAKTVQSYNHTIVLRTIYTSCTILRSTPHTKLEMAADRQIGQGG